MYQSSSCQYGYGTSKPVTRRTGPRRSRIAFSARIAATSAAKPSVRGASWTTTARPVLRTEASSASSSSGFSVRRSSTSQEASPARASAARSATGDHRAVGDERHVRSLAGDARLAERDDVLAVRHIAAGGAVDQLGLEDHDRVGIPDRGGEQALSRRRVSTGSPPSRRACARSRSRASRRAARAPARRRRTACARRAGSSSCPSSASGSARRG